MLNKTRLRKLHERKSELVKAIHYYGEEKRRIIKNVEDHTRAYHGGFISHESFLRNLNNLLKGTSLNERIEHHNKHIEHYNNKLNACEKEISREASRKAIKTKVIPIMLVLGILAMLGAGLQFTDIQTTITGAAVADFGVSIEGGRDYRPDENPIFEIDINEKKGNLITGYAIGPPEDKNIEAMLVTPVGAELILNDEITGTPKGFSIELNKGREFRAGLYQLKVKTRHNGEEFIKEQNFTWGVLAINVDKSIYLENEKAFIGMAVLDNYGRTVCNATVSLSITDPLNNVETLSTKNGMIKISNECEIYGITNLPDYYSSYGVEGTGEYVMELTAETYNGVRSITDKFVVRDSVDFDVKREGPTRIYPPVDYIMKFTIKANEDYKGTIKEYVPASFEIAPQAGLTTIKAGDTKVLIWERELIKGKEYKVHYEFDAPDISPEFYLLGPLEIGSFREIRQWQIASDVLKIQDSSTTLTAGTDPTDELTTVDITMTVDTNSGGGGGESAGAFLQYGVSIDANDQGQGGTTIGSICGGNAFRVTSRTNTCDGSNLACSNNADGFTIDYNVLAKSATTQTMTWTIEACSGSGGSAYDISSESNAGSGGSTLDTWYEALDINVPLNNVPVNFLLNAPLNNTNTTDSTPKFEWFNSSDADNDGINYSLEIWNDTLMTQIAYMNISINGTLIENQTNLTIPTPLLDGTYYWRVNVTDYTDSNFSRNNFTFTIDTTPPDVVLDVPLNLSNFSVSSVDINFSASDLTLLLESCVYDLNQTDTNVTLTNCANTTVLLDEGYHNITLYTNDTLGNLNQTPLTFFTVDTTGPTISDANVNESNVTLNSYVCYNSTVTEDLTTLSNVWAYVTNPNSVNTNYTLTDTGVVCAGNAGDNIFGAELQLDVLGNWTFNYTFANDTLGNVNNFSALLDVNVTAAPAPSGDPNLRPNITFVSLNSTETVIAGGLRVLNFSFIANDTNGAVGLDNSSIIANFTFVDTTAEEFTRGIICSVSQFQTGLQGTERNYSCGTDNITFYDASGSWKVSLSIADNESNYTSNTSMHFTIAQTVSINLSLTTLNFPGLTPGEDNVTSSNDPQIIQNIGNKNNISINLTAYDLIGDSNGDPAKRLEVLNFTVNYITNAAEVECNYNGTASSGAGARLLNATGVPANITIVKGADRTNSTYFCLLHVPGTILPQAYSTGGTPDEDDWIFTAG